MKMNSASVPPVGVYVLTEDVENPLGDHRCRANFWRRPTWKKGQKFVVEPLEPGSDRHIIRPISMHAALTFTTVNEAKLNLLLPFLRPVPSDTFDDALLACRECGLGPEGILARLHAQGKVTVADLVALLDVQREVIYGSVRKEQP